MNTTLYLTDYFALSPLFILLGGGLLLILLESFCKKTIHLLAFPLTLLTLILALGFTYLSPSSTNPLLTPWLRFDFYAKCFSYLFLLIGLGTACLSYSLFKRFQVSQGEYYFLLLSSVIGMSLIGSAADFLTLFLGLEILSVSVYVLCGYMKKWKGSCESAIKYFLMGSVATGFFLYGIALIYGAAGTTSFDYLFNSYKSAILLPERTLFLGGIALVTFGLAFKVAAVPFHFWAPDVYAGAATPVTGLMATGIKVGAFAAFFRVFLETLRDFDPIWNNAIAILAYPTLIYANFVALKQTHLRRFFAYSGISHAGYLLIPLAVGGPEATQSLIFYLVIYVLATLGAFAVVAILDKDDKGITFHDLKGLFHSAPLYAFILSFCLLTLAGFPPTIGFFAKFYIFKAAFQAQYYDLVILGLLMTILSTFYYFRIITIMLQPAETEIANHSNWPEKIFGSLTTAALIIISFYPSFLLNYIV